MISLGFSSGRNSDYQLWKFGSRFRATLEISDLGYSPAAVCGMDRNHGTKGRAKHQEVPPAPPHVCELEFTLLLDFHYASLGQK